MKEYLKVELPNKDVDEETRARLKEEYEEGIKNYTQKYSDAPETVNEVIEPIFTNQYIIQYSEQESSGNDDENAVTEKERKSAREYYEEQNTEVIDVNWDYKGDTHYLTVGRSDNVLYNGLSFYRVEEIANGNQSYPITESSSDIEGLITTYNKAKAIAENTVIQKLGIDYLTITHSAREKDSCYVFFFTRNIDGVNTTYCANNQGYDRYDKAWKDEKLYIIVDDKGIKKIWMQSSLSKLGEEISDDAILLPFNKIKKIAKEQFEIGNIDFNGTMIVGNAYEGLKEMNLNIDKIILGYTRVKLSDSSGRYVMVPVWDFLGSFKASGKYSSDGDEFAVISKDIDYVSNYRHSYLTINAIDGSIIDRSLGY